MSHNRSPEDWLALRNTLQTARDYDMLDTLEAFDAGDMRCCYSADTDWPDHAELCSPFVTAREVFGQ